MEIKNKPFNDIQGKKVLLVGLGILGGGIATAKWLLEKGALLTITDLKDENYLAKSISKISYYAKATKDRKRSPIKYVLGKHEEEDFKNCDLVVLNPDVPYDSHFVNIAKQNKIPVVNEQILFVDFVKSKNVIAVTGTRGKTTTVNWVAYLVNELLGKTFVTGNSPTVPFLNEIKKIKEKDFVVIETSSFHLEVEDKNFKPKVAVITNIYIDHIARHKSEEIYANTKANIFLNQDKDDFLILNGENKWTKEFLTRNLKQKVLLFSTKVLPKSVKDGIYLDKDGAVVLRRQGKEEIVLKSKDFPNDFGDHNKSNLMIAILVLNIYGADIKNLKKYLDKLPKIKIREEKIYEDKKLKVINDSAATSPEATIAAVNRFKGNNLILITGGTDKGLEYGELGKFLSKNISPENLILLEGSATEKLKKNLSLKTLNEFGTLEECLRYAKSQITNPKSQTNFKLQTTNYKQTVIVFSPGAKSFEKFKNEFDRGEKFNKLFKKIFNI